MGVKKFSQKLCQRIQGSSMTSYLVHNSSHGVNTTSPIVFIHEDNVGVHDPHCDALLVRTIVAKKGLNCMLVDNGSSVNILFRATYDKMLKGHKLTPWLSYYMALLEIMSFSWEDYVGYRNGDTLLTAHHFIEVFHCRSQVHLSWSTRTTFIERTLGHPPLGNEVIH